MASNIFKTLNLIQLYLRPSDSSAHKNNTTLLESKGKPITSLVVNLTKNKGIKTLKLNATTGFYSED